MNKHLIAATLFAILSSCGSKNEDIPTISYSGQFLNYYNEDVNIPNQEYDWWSVFNPQIECKVIGYDTIVSDGNHFKDLVNYEISGSVGNLSIQTEKEEITRIFQTNISTMTFSEGEIGNCRIKHNGIFQNGEQIIVLSDFKYIRRSSSEISKNKIAVNSTFKGSGPHSHDKDIIIRNGEEEYVLKCISETQIRIEQTRPAEREIGIIDRD